MAENHPVRSLLIPIFKGVMELSSVILKQKTSPLRQNIVLSVSDVGKNDTPPDDERVIVTRDGHDQTHPEQLAFYGEKISNSTDSDWENKRELLKEQLGRLLLWKLDFQENQLESIIYESFPLAEGVFMTLLSLGQTLVNILELDDTKSSTAQLRRKAKDMQGLLDQHQKLLEQQKQQKKQQGREQVNDNDNQMAQDPEVSDDSDYYLSSIFDMEEEQVSVLESMGIDIDQLYLLGPTMKKLLANKQPLKRQKRESSPPKTQSGSAKAGIAKASTAKGSTREQRPLDLGSSQDKTGIPDSLPISKSSFTREPLSPPSPTTPQQQGQTAKRKLGTPTLPKELIVRSAKRQICKTCKDTLISSAGDICSACKSKEQPLPRQLRKQSKRRNAEDSSTANINQKIIFDIQTIPEMRGFWDNLASLGNFEALRKYSGKRIVLNVSNVPLQDPLFRASSLSIHPVGSDGVLSTVDVLCNDLNQLKIHDKAPTEDIATRSLALLQQGQTPQRNCKIFNDDLKPLSQLDNLTLTLALLESLHASTIYITNGNESIVRIVVSLTYGRLLEQFLKYSDMFWEHIHPSLLSREPQIHKELYGFLGYHILIKRLLSLGMSIPLENVWNSVKQRLNYRLDQMEKYSEKVTKKNFPTKQRTHGTRDKSDSQESNITKLKKYLMRDQELDTASILEPPNLPELHLLCCSGDEDDSLDRIMLSSISQAVYTTTFYKLLEGIRADS